MVILDIIEPLHRLDKQTLEDRMASRSPLTHLIDVDLGEGRTFTAELTDTNADVALRDGRLLVKLAQVKESMSAMVSSIAEMIDAAAAERPLSSASAEFAVKFSASTPAGIVLGQLGGESSVLVRLEWDLSARRPGADSS